MIPGSASAQFFGAAGSAGGGAGGYEIERSLRFNSADSAYLSRTPSVVSNRRTWTWAGWVKRSTAASGDCLFQSRNGSNTVSTHFEFFFSNDSLSIGYGDANWLVSSAVFRDFSAWYHVVLSVDTTQADGADRHKLYVNGSQITAFTTNSPIPQNTDTAINNSVIHAIGARFNANEPNLNGYLADVHFIDGQALDPSSFGEFDTNGVWQPIAYAGTYGTSGVTFSTFTNPANAFDNDGNTFATVAGTGNLGQFTNLSISVSSSLSLKIASGTSGTIYVNGVGTSFSGDPSIRTISISSPPAVVTSIEIQSGSQPDVYEVVADGSRVVAALATGVNSFHLPFSDNSTAAALGTDTSGNGNTWTVNNFSVISNPGALTFSGFHWTQYKSTFNDNTVAQTKTGSKYRIALDDLFAGVDDGTSYSASTLFGITKFNSQGYIHDSLISADGTATTGFDNSSYTGLFWKGYFNYPANSGKYASITVYDGSDPDGTDYAVSRAANDSLVDSPTNYGTDSGTGGEVRGNYATLNPLQSNSTGPLANGNLEWGGTNAGNFQSSVATVGMSSGKWYAEFTISGTSGDITCGIARITNSQELVTTGNFVGGTATSYGYYASTGNKFNSASGSSYGAAYADGDTVGVAFDADNGTLAFYKNGVSQGTAFTGLTGTFAFACSAFQTTKWIANFGQRPFAYTAPSGFKALCTTNLPEPTIADGSTAMDVALYTGNGSTQTISGLNFSPDLVWIKERSGTRFHALCDSVRGDGLLLYSNSTLGEQDIGSSVVDLTSDGFNLGFNSGYTAVSHNWNAVTHAAWTWDAGSSTVTNTQGSITSQVRANASAGFSVVTYTGNGVNATVGHGLGVAPRLVIVKNRDATGIWPVFHSDMGGLGKYLILNDPTRALNEGGSYWQNTAPTSTLLYLGGGLEVNADTQKIVAYCFAPVAGYSAFGSYLSNFDNDGPFVYTGFRPRFLLIKNATDTTYAANYSWALIDTQRYPYNQAPGQLNALWANRPAIENQYGTGTDPGVALDIDILSNGFKLRCSNVEFNYFNSTYIYAAFAEHPFATSRAR